MGVEANKCKKCDFASSDQSNLKRHLKSHNGGKIYKCNQCDIAFAHAGNLRMHLKTHTGEKSNKCNQCDYASSYDRLWAGMHKPFPRGSKFQDQ